MGHAAVKTKLMAGDFLAWDATQTDRHEFFDGEVYAMAGAEDRHVTVAGNMYVALRQHLAGTPCRTFMSDMKVHVTAANCYFYPDVLVTCSAADHASPLVKSEPKLVIEVLSSSTAGYDRGDKFAAYRQLPTLQEYVLVDINSRRSDVYRMNSHGLWELHPFEIGQTVQLASVELAIMADQLFAEVDPPVADADKAVSA